MQKWQDIMKTQQHSTSAGTKLLVGTGKDTLTHRGEVHYCLFDHIKFMNLNFKLVIKFTF